MSQPVKSPIRGGKIMKKVMNIQFQLVKRFLHSAAVLAVAFIFGSGSAQAATGIYGGYLMINGVKYKSSSSYGGSETALSAVTSLGLPSAVISGAVCAILHLIKKVVKNLYRVAEAAWFISATGNDQAFSIAISDYNKTLETSPFSSLFAMMNFPNQFTAYLQRLVLIKIAAQRKIPPALKIEHDAKLAVKLAQKEQFGFEPEDCYYFVESTTPYVPLIK
jgi:hypothetical protein